MRVVAASVLIVSCTVALGFIVNRLEGLARSLPIIEGVLIVAALVGARVFARLHHAGRRKSQVVRNVAPAAAGATENVLVVGINRLSELYLRAVTDLGEGQIKIAGLLGSNPHHVGRLLQEHAVLGRPEDVAPILKDLEVHGVFVSRIVVTVALEKLSPPAREALLSVERDSDIKLEFFAEHIGLGRGSDRIPRSAEAPASTGDDTGTGTFDVGDLTGLKPRRYWRVKRAIDVLGAAGAIVVLSPLMLVISVLVALDVGLPVVFWQQRPGAGGLPFRLFKFRTMASPHDSAGGRVADAQRLSIIGRFLRRTRLDELPQLYNVLIGEMSFIGPRPLLPVDQFPALSARLAVRPGLTGWAQIKGGRELTASDKAALDIWYLKHASLAVDLAIMAGTVRMIATGERTDRRAIRAAWRELGCRWRVPGPIPRPALSEPGALPSRGVKSEYSQPPALRASVSGRRA
jgi:lipopolysaccharide/colanic/teichoic acid biosynthesis glycosyltransferase